MPRAPISIPFNNFVGGLVTEATGLSYPPNSCRDLSNVEIELSGLIRRRLGLERERAGQNLEFNLGGYTEAELPVEDIAVTVHEWQSANNEPGRDYVVVQVGNLLRILKGNVESLTEEILGADFGLVGVNAATVVLDTEDFNLLRYSSLADPGAGVVDEVAALLQNIRTPLSSALGKGRLWFTSPHHIPFSLVYDSDNNLFRLAAIGQRDETLANPGVNFDYRSTAVTYAIRDLIGVPDGYAVDERRADISPAHGYNLFNQGFGAYKSDGSSTGTTFAEAFRISQGVWPGNIDQVALGKKDDGTYDPVIGQRFATSGANAPRGTSLIFIPDGNRDRPDLSTKDGSPDAFAGSLTDSERPALDMNDEFDEPQEAGFRSIAFFGERVWLAGDVCPKRANGVYFSQVLTDVRNAGKFYQENDPTSPDFPDLLATDGGVIYIPEADRIERIVPVGIGLLAIAGNGVWFIYGGESNFSALDYVVNKVSDIGTTSGFSVVTFEGQCMFWSTGGIYQVIMEGGVALGVQALTDKTIRSFFQGLSLTAKTKVVSFVDEFSKRLYWLYPSEDLEQFNFARDRYLVLDLRMGCFFKGTLPYLASSVDRYERAFVTVGFGRRDANTAALIDGSTVTDLPTYGLVSNVKFFTWYDPVVDTPAEDALCSFTIAELYSAAFTDYPNLAGGAVEYSSFIETAPLIMDDLQRNKQATYVHSFFKKTEFTLAETDVPGVLTAIIPSSCKLQGRWDFHVTAAGGRFSDEQQAYKLRRPFIPAVDQTEVDTGEDLVYTKRKVRGKGRALSLRYSSESGKDFQLAGFSVDATVAAE